jgi:hypothetical protein
MTTMLVLVQGSFRAKQKSALFKRLRAVRQVHFAKELITAIHESKESVDEESNCTDSSPFETWLTTAAAVARLKNDAKSVKRDATVQRYLSISDAAYLEVVNASNQDESYIQACQQRMSETVHNDHRALEYHSHDGRSRSHLRRLVIRSTVAQARLLARQECVFSGWGLMTTVSTRDLSLPSPVHALTLADSHQLRKHSLKLSRRAKEWALFLAQVDAMVAQQEYSSIQSILPLSA